MIITERGVQYQGRPYRSLSEVGRREEMGQAWESVPEQFRNQVNIEVVRGKLSQATLRDRFKIDKSQGWERGF